MNQLSATLIGALVSTLATVIVLTFRDEHHVPLSSFLIGVGAGLFVGIVLGLVGEWRKRRQDRWAYQERQRRCDVSKLQELQGDIWFARQNLTQALFNYGNVVVALQEMGDLDSKLLQLSITLPEFPPDSEADAVAEGWESFLDKLYPYARDGDIAGARRLGRLTWRVRLSRRVRERWRRLSRWCRFKVRRLRSNPKRSRPRGRRSGGARRG